MGKFLVTQEATPAAPGAGVTRLYPDNGNGLFVERSVTAGIRTVGGIHNCNTADVVASGADTYLTGSNLTVPQHLLQAKTKFLWRFAMSKTAAGTAAPVWTLRVGTAGTTADTARCTFTSPLAQTAATDIGGVEILAILRNTGAAGVIAADLVMWHANATTGFATLGTVAVQNTSAGFDTTAAGLIVGISVNPGASGVWTHQLVRAEMVGV